MSEIKKTTLHPENDNNIDLYPKTSADQIEGLSEFIGTQYVTITPASATSGTISSGNLSILQDDGNNLLVKNNRYYRQTQTNGSIMYYTAVDNGITYQVAINTDNLTWEYSENQIVDVNTSQNISGIKTFTNYVKAQYVANLKGSALIREKSDEGKSVFGNDSTGAVIMGNGDRPYYSKSGSDFVGAAIALLSDITGGSSAKVYRHTVQFYFISAFASSQEVVYDYAGTKQSTSSSAYYTVDLYTTSNEQITTAANLFNLLMGKPHPVLIDKEQYYGGGYLYATSASSSIIYGNLRGVSTNKSFNFSLNIQTSFYSLVTILSDTVTEM